MASRSKQEELEQHMRYEGSWFRIHDSIDHISHIRYTPLRPSEGESRQPNTVVWDYSRAAGPC